MSKPNLRTEIAITLRNGAGVIAELEIKHHEAERALAGAERALKEASARYDAALGEGREAALAARQVRTTAEVDLDIARRGAENLGRRVADAHEALRLAGIEHKRTEAERLRSVFEETARQGLARMSVDARSILRAWAEAELAIREAWAAQGAKGPGIPDAEEFRSVRRGTDREVQRTQITRWIRPGTQEPYADEIEREIVRHGSTGFLRNPAMPNGGREIAERGVFDRVTYEKATGAIHMPKLIESLCVPALVGGQVPGWMPVEGHVDPRTILARLAELEHPSAEPKGELQTVDTFVHLVGAEAAAASA